MTLAKIKGQMSVSGMVIGGIASVITAFVTGSFAANGEVANLKTEIAVVRTTEELHYLEVQKQLEVIDSKLDGILQSLRNNPNY